MSLMEPLAIRLSGQTTPAKSLVMPRYPEYKASGVEWLGDVPGHWEVKRLKHNLKLLTEKTDHREHPVALENIESWSGRFIETETKFEGDGVAFNQGDILFGKLRPYLAKAYLATTAGEAVGDFHVMHPYGDVDGRFAQYQILNRDFIAIVDGSTFGAKMPRASWDFMCNMALTTPPKPEQQTIAAFLDRETWKIDALISEQRRLVELLAEKRQAVISHAVTKGISQLRHSGLDPESSNQTISRSGQSGCPATQEFSNELDSGLHRNDGVAMKDSGIEWLGEVPEHWRIGAVKRFFTSYNPRRVPLSGEERSGRSGDYAYYGASGIIDYIDEYIFDEDLVLVSEDGANLVNRVTPIAFVATGKYWVNNHAHILKPLDENLIFWAERLEMIDLAPFITGSAQPKLTSEALNSLVISVPPTFAERLAIENYIVIEIAKFDTLTLEANRAIELLQERRSALISAAVTGKIDVRGDVAC